MPRSTSSFLKSHAPLLGVAAGLLFIIGSIILSTHRLFSFINIEGLVIVVGGVIAVAFISFERADVQRALQAIRATFGRSRKAAPDTLRGDMLGIMAWAQIVKEKGMRNLETILGKSGIDDPFISYGLNMVVSGYTAPEVRAMMETAADAGYERDSIPVDVLQSMVSHAPAFGMVGTLVGMIIMLCNLTDNVSSIGSSLSVAFLATLYGVVSARMVYMPAAAKLRQEVEKRRFRNQLITEGMVMLVSDRTPMYIQDRLNSFLQPEFHNYYNYFDKSPKPTVITPRLKVRA